MKKTPTSRPASGNIQPGVSTPTATSSHGGSIQHLYESPVHNSAPSRVPLKQASLGLSYGLPALENEGGYLLSFMLQCYLKIRCISF